MLRKLVARERAFDSFGFMKRPILGINAKKAIATPTAMIIPESQR
jgi:hypothetical protein